MVDKKIPKKSKFLRARVRIPAALPAAKRSPRVAPEVDLGECTLHSPPQKVNKAEPTLALKPRGDVTRNPKQG